MAKSLLTILPKKSGRNSSGQVTVRHQGGRPKRYLRSIDWKRDRRDLPARVVAIEYDPNRSADIAAVVYGDGQRRYVLAPQGLEVGQIVMAGESAAVAVGNALPLKAVPVGTAVHALEIRPGKGAQLVRGAGTAAFVQGVEAEAVVVKLPSGEIRRFSPVAYATIGQVGKSAWRSRVWGKAGARRRLGIRPTVRGTAQNPRSHPHGGGEGRSGEGMHPKTPWGRPARGKRTRTKGKYSQRLIAQSRYG